MAGKTRAQLETELRQLKAAKLTDGFVTVARDLIQWVALAVIAYFVYLSVAALAGRETSADIGIQVLGTFNVSVALSWTVGLIGTMYGYSQRNLRRDTIERLQLRIVELERIIDDRRSSSRLTPRGETRPEDRT